MKVGIVTGEASGDLLGSELMAALRQLDNEMQFLGVGGERMRGQGLHALESIDRFSMNGFVEPLSRLPELLKLLNSLTTQLADTDVMVGVDFNVFNLMLEKRLKDLGTPTVHYVSPSVYAWRQNRVRKIEKSADVLLTLFPFEPEYYKNTGTRAVYVGHPLADRINPNRDRESERANARSKLAIDQSHTAVAMLPGSRTSEIKSHLNLFLRAAERVQSLLSPARRFVFIIPCLSESRAKLVQHHSRKFSHLDVRVVTSDSIEVFAACDAALVKSGTSTLEAMLMRIPMVVAYRAGPFTYSIVRSVLQTQWVALPNILTRRELVPEFLQQAATPESLAVSLCQEIEYSELDNRYFSEFDLLHKELRCNASSRAAKAVLNLVGTR